MTIKLNHRRVTKSSRPNSLKNNNLHTSRRVLVLVAQSAVQSGMKLHLVQWHPATWERQVPRQGQRAYVRKRWQDERKRSTLVDERKRKRLFWPTMVFKLQRQRQRLWTILHGWIWTGRPRILDQWFFPWPVWHEAASTTSCPHWHVFRRQSSRANFVQDDIWVWRHQPHQNPEGRCGEIIAHSEHGFIVIYQFTTDSFFSNNGAWKEECANQDIEFSHATGSDHCIIRSVESAGGVCWWIQVLAQAMLDQKPWETFGERSHVEE